MTRINSNGIELNVDISGPAGAPVLMLSNSIAATLAMWDPQMVFWTKALRVLRYDTRGHGQSDVPAGAYSIDELGHDAIGILDALKIDKVHFCGLSLGGMTGMWLADRYPSRIDKLVLSNCVPHIGHPEVWNPRIDKVLAEGMPALADGLIQRWFKEDFKAREPALYSSLLQAIRDTPSEGYAGCCAVLRDADLGSTLASIKSPTLIIGATHDLATPSARCREVSAAIAGSRYVELDAAHVSNVERPHEFSSAVLSFLG